MPTTAGRRPHLDTVTVLAVLLALFALARMWDFGRLMPGIDFYQFWVGAQVAGRAGSESFYSPQTGALLGREYLARAQQPPRDERWLAAAQARRELDLYSSPLLYATFDLLVTDRYERDLHVFRFLSLAAAVAGLVVLGRLLGYTPAATWLLVALVAEFFQAMKSDIRVGNVNQLQLGLLGLFFWLQSLGRTKPGAQVAAGSVLALLVGFKPNMIYLPPLLLLAWFSTGRGREAGRQLAGMSLGAAVAFAVGSLHQRSITAWFDWIAAVRDLPPSITPLNVGNFGIARLAWEQLGVSISGFLTVAVLTAVVALLVARRKSLAQCDAVTADVVVAGLGCLVFLLTAPLVWQHYLLLALPLLVYLLRPDADVGLKAIGVIAWTAIAIDGFSELLAVRGLTAQAIVVDAGLVLLLVSVLWDVTTTRAEAFPGT